MNCLTCLHRLLSNPHFINHIVPVTNNIQKLEMMIELIESGKLGYDLKKQLLSEYQKDGLILSDIDMHSTENHLVKILRTISKSEYNDLFYSRTEIKDIFKAIVLQEIKLDVENYNKEQKINTTQGIVFRVSKIKDFSKMLHILAIYGKNQKLLYNSFSKLIRNNFGQFSVNSFSERYLTFEKNHSCVSCGLIADFMALERTNGTPVGKYHFNLYGVDDEGREVLFTKDHILPKSKGGMNHLSNYQTMCNICNEKKGNKI